MHRRLSRQTSYSGWVVAIIVVLAAVAAGVYLARRAIHPAVSPAAPPAVQPAMQPASAASFMKYPFAQGRAGATPASTVSLGSLSDSDASVREALRGLVHGDHLASLLRSQIIWRVVATVDALPRQDVGSASILPLRPPKGVMQTQQVNGASVIAAGNAERYAPYMTVLAEADLVALVAWYQRNYPLFQQAYRELGYPHGSFNDRLVLAIDNMLATPPVQGPIAVVRSGAHYHFADLELESLSNGQKLMLRLGPQNEAQFKTKLRMIRELLTDGQSAH